LSYGCRYQIQVIIYHFLRLFTRKKYLHWLIALNHKKGNHARLA